MFNFNCIREERIRRLEKKMGRLADKLVQRYSSSDLSQFLKAEKEIEIQKAYLIMEAANG